MNMTEAVQFLGCSKRTVQRYIEKGKIPFTEKNGERKFRRKDLAPILLKLIESREKHRPDIGENPVNLTDLKKIKRVISKPSKPLLNDFGTQVLMETTKVIESNNLLKGIEKSTILRYALAVQMKDQYLNSFINGDSAGDPFYINTAKVFQSEIQHYEKELGLTPASLSRIKPHVEEDNDKDDMEDLLNG